nr:hypothetical protein CFP56_23926 [Quercus suber]
MRGARKAAKAAKRFVVGREQCGDLVAWQDLRSCLSKGAVLALKLTWSLSRFEMVLIRKCWPEDDDRAYARLSHPHIGDDCTGLESQLLQGSDLSARAGLRYRSPISIAQPEQQFCHRARHESVHIRACAASVYSEEAVKSLSHPGLANHGMSSIWDERWEDVAESLHSWLIDPFLGRSET